MAYGYRLWAEGQTGRNIDNLNDEAAVADFLRRVIREAGMTLAIGPFTYKEPPRDIGKGPGVTGIAVLVESSVHLHTYPEQRYFFFELFSCKHFDYRSIMDVVREFTGALAPECAFDPVGQGFPEPALV